MSDIQFGESVKRGQSGEAYKTVGGFAEGPNVDMAYDDRKTAEEMIYGLTIDAARQYGMRRDRLRKLLGARIPDSAIRTAFSKPAEDQIDEIVIPPESQRNLPASEVRDQFTEAVKMGVVEPLQAQREMFTQANVVMNSTMAAAKRKQDLETQLLVAGEQAEVADGEDHANAIWALEMYMSSTRWMNLTEDQQRAVQEHWAVHKESQQNELLYDQVAAEGQSGPGPGAPSPPGAATTNFAQQPELAGSVQ